MPARSVGVPCTTPESVGWPTRQAHLVLTGATARIRRGWIERWIADDVAAGRRVVAIDLDGHLVTTLAHRFGGRSDTAIVDPRFPPSLPVDDALRRSACAVAARLDDAAGRTAAALLDAIDGDHRELAVSVIGADRATPACLSALADRLARHDGSLTLDCASLAGLHDDDLRRAVGLVVTATGPPAGRAWRTAATSVLQRRAIDGRPTWLDEWSARRDAQ